jgi:hypothetical protein
MRNSNIFPFSSDPNLKRRKEIRKIQPLFKKHFQISTKVSPSITPSLQPVEFTQETPAESPQNVPLIELETEEDILFEIKQLSGERLAALKDLFSYEEKYKNKLCLKARISNLFQLCDNLQDLLNVASSYLVKETDLYERLSAGIDTIKLKEQKFKSAHHTLRGIQMPAISDNSPVKHENLVETQHCVNISGLTCLVYIKSNAIAGMFSVRIHIDSVIDVFEYELNKFSLSIPEARQNSNFLKKAIEWDILPYFYFRASGGELQLGFERSFEEYSMVLIAHIKGVEYNYTSIRIQEQENNILLSLLEPSISIDPLSVSVSKSKLKIDSIKELIAPHRRLEVIKTIEKNLSVYFRNSTITLEWDTHNWDFERLIQKQKSLNSPRHFNVLKCSQNPELYSQFDVPLYSGSISFKDVPLSISFLRNSILETFRISVQLNDSQHKFREEDHRDEFLMLRCLQSEGILNSYKTLMMSLELRHFLEQMLNMR